MIFGLLQKMTAPHAHSKWFNIILIACIIYLEKLSPWTRGLVYSNMSPMRYCSIVRLQKKILVYTQADR